MNCCHCHVCAFLLQFSFVVDCCRRRCYSVIEVDCVVTSLGRIPSFFFSFPRPNACMSPWGTLSFTVVLLLLGGLPEQCAAGLPYPAQTTDTGGRAVRACFFGRHNI